MPKAELGSAEPDGRNRLAENVMHYARLLRAAGLPIGTGQVLDAVRALEAIGLSSRTDVYWALHSVFISRHEQTTLFDSAFHLFWRNVDLLRKAMAMSLPQTPAEIRQTQEQTPRRLAEALLGASKAEREGETEGLENDRALSFSPGEVLQKKDFEQMSQAELAEVRQALRRIRFSAKPVATRRRRPALRGRTIDLRQSLRASLKGGGAIIDLKRKAKAVRLPALVVLCDISGSMSRYSRLFLHFMHGVTNDRDRVHALVFGTRLTNISRYLRDADVDRALDKVSTAVEDWAGGTRIGQCLHEFNRLWSRRTLSQGAIVLLVTDGLDRDAGQGLAQEMERLHRSCRRLIWLNPLLRFQGFEPKSLGIRAILPYVDEFRPVHNLESFRDLADALSETESRELAA